ASSGASGLAQSRFVKFNYEDRPDPIWHYTSTILGYSWERLISIVTSVGGSVVKTYHIDYEPNRPDLQSRVKTVRECAPEGTGEVCKGPTTFTYLEAPSAQTGTSSFVFGAGGSAGAAVGAITADVDGDGRDDILAFSYNDFGAAWLLARRPHVSTMG